MAKLKEEEGAGCDAKENEGAEKELEEPKPKEKAGVEDEEVGGAREKVDVAEGPVLKLNGCEKLVGAKLLVDEPKLNPPNPPVPKAGADACPVEGAENDGNEKENAEEDCG